MGCHTWFYKKIDPQPTYEEVKTSVISAFTEEIEFCKKVIEGTDVVFGFNSKDATKQKETYERQLLLIEKDRCKEAVCRRYNPNPFSSFNILYKNKCFYSDNTRYHDAFRIGGYPDDVLFSLEETIKYIEKHKNEIQLFPETYKQLEQFWKEFPDGVI